MTNNDDDDSCTTLGSSSYALLPTPESTKRLQKQLDDLLEPSPATQTLERLSQSHKPYVLAAEEYEESVPLLGSSPISLKDHVGGAETTAVDTAETEAATKKDDANTTSNADRTVASPTSTAASNPAFDPVQNVVTNALSSDTVATNAATTETDQVPDVHTLLDDLQVHNITIFQRGKLGLLIVARQIGEQEYCIVKSVSAQSVAEEAGFLPGDVFLASNQDKQWLQLKQVSHLARSTKRPLVLHVARQEGLVQKLLFQDEEEDKEEEKETKQEEEIKEEEAMEDSSPTTPEHQETARALLDLSQSAKMKDQKNYDKMEKHSPEQTAKALLNLSQSQVDDSQWVRRSTRQRARAEHMVVPSATAPVLPDQLALELLQTTPSLFCRACSNNGANHHVRCPHHPDCDRERLQRLVQGYNQSCPACRQEFRYGYYKTKAHSCGMDAPASRQPSPPNRTLPSAPSSLQTKVKRAVEIGCQACCYQATAGKKSRHTRHDEQCERNAYYNNRKDSSQTGFGDWISATARGKIVRVRVIVSSKRRADAESEMSQESYQSLSKKQRIEQGVSVGCAACIYEQETGGRNGSQPHDKVCPRKGRRGRPRGGPSVTCTTPTTPAKEEPVQLTGQSEIKQQRLLQGVELGCLTCIHEHRNGRRVTRPHGVGCPRRGRRGVVKLSSPTKTESTLDAETQTRDKDERGGLDDDNSGQISQGADLGGSTRRKQHRSGKKNNRLNDKDRPRKSDGFAIKPHKKIHAVFDAIRAEVPGASESQKAGLEDGQLTQRSMEAKLQRGLKIGCRACLREHQSGKRAKYLRHDDECERSSKFREKMFLAITANKSSILPDEQGGLLSAATETMAMQSQTQISQLTIVDNLELEIGVRVGCLSCKLEKARGHAVTHMRHHQLCPRNQEMALNHQGLGSPELNKNSSVFLKEANAVASKSLVEDVGGTTSAVDKPTGLKSADEGKGMISLTDQEQSSREGHVALASLSQTLGATATESRESCEKFDIDNSPVSSETKAANEYPNKNDVASTGQPEPCPGLGTESAGLTDSTEAGTEATKLLLVEKGIIHGNEANPAESCRNQKGRENQSRKMSVTQRDENAGTSSTLEVDFAERELELAKKRFLDEAVSIGSVTVPFCLLCRGYSKVSAHHSLCPKHPQFEKSGALEKLERIRLGVKKECPACLIQFEKGALAKHKMKHNSACKCFRSDRQRKEAEKQNPQILHVQKQKVSLQSGTYTKIIRSAGKTPEVKSGRNKADGKAMRVTPDGLLTPTPPEGGRVRLGNKINLVKPVWSKCGNPWGIMGFSEGDVVLSGEAGFTHHEAFLTGKRFAIDPFVVEPAYKDTHYLPGEGTHTLKLSRDAMAVIPWGITFEHHDFGGACLVQSVDPNSPAAQACYIGSALKAPVSVNDMILAINGKEVGGMTEVGLEIEMETCGVEMTLTISRYRFPSRVGKCIAEIQNGTWAALEYSLQDKRNLGWCELDLSSSWKCNGETADNAGDSQIQSHNEESPSDQVADDSVVEEKSHEGQNLGGIGEDHTNGASVVCSENEWEEDDNPWAGCVCGEIHESPTVVFWIQCEGCEAWYNVAESCVGFDEDAAQSKSHWNCRACPSPDRESFVEKSCIKLKRGELD